MQITDASEVALVDDESECEEATRPREGNYAFTSFTVQLDNPAGNSFVEFLESIADPKWNLRYARTHKHNIALVIAAPDDAESDPDVIKRMKAATDEAMAGKSPGEIDDNEICVLPGSCSSCGQPPDISMKVNILYFKVRDFVQNSQYQLTRLRSKRHLHVDKL